ncbi:hypothetical protein AGABI1DRAFT_64398 [Agaricus bisporus var. burnettii JB137-S8]|uniref:DUF6699 domain-containing protein n=1 Tax=Agaricus bisporus var. burnettii (strain JB137-S8 / ATCC MYA-4627 / FGSC 10392) TaxID=597362 RepID=K5WYF1_AGABU|nr:uncharacterized protein AGABI1DRAFT_64398 [Agaricus bisporus var. burnettii JB137-S8]EKM75607.1 hypothetical protein AGABI1DRAFT_64398 [Agaricus bisporus var. burnettii JB137-S8]
MSYPYYNQPPWTQPRAPTWAAPHIQAPAWAPPHDQAPPWVTSHNSAPTWAPSTNIGPMSRAPPINSHPQQSQSHFQPFIPPKPTRRGSISQRHPGEGNPEWSSDAHGNRGRSQVSQPEPSVEQLVPAFAKLGPSDPLLASEPCNPAGYSRRWPKLNCILEANVTPIRYYATNKPGREISASYYSRYKDVHAMRTDTRHMRLVGKNFPWTHEISGQVNISVEDIWSAVYRIFNQPLNELDWAVICNDGDAGERKIMAMKKAREKRISLNSLSFAGYMRIDYLGEEIYFYGLEKDEEYERRRFYLFDPTKRTIPILEDTWIVKMAKHPRKLTERNAST